jgi:S-ribosylhomocysteine lyase
MPLLDSFRVDHTIMKAPAVRVAKKMTTSKGDIITVFDLRFYRPNVKKMDAKGLHTLEHLFAGFMREHLDSKKVHVIDCSPMGCRTGFYMSVVGKPKENQVVNAMHKSLRDVLTVKKMKDIPELNIYQCGSYKMHSLKNAKKIAKNVLSKEIGVSNNKKLFLSDERMKELGI